MRILVGVPILGYDTKKMMRVVEAVSDLPWSEHTFDVLFFMNFKTIEEVKRVQIIQNEMSSIFPNNVYIKASHTPDCQLLCARLNIFVYAKNYEYDFLLNVDSDDVLLFKDNYPLMADIVKRNPIVSSIVKYNYRFVSPEYSNYHFALKHDIFYEKDGPSPLPSDYNHSIAYSLISKELLSRICAFKGLQTLLEERFVTYEDMIITSLCCHFADRYIESTVHIADYLISAPSTNPIKSVNSPMDIHNTYISESSKLERAIKLMEAMPSSFIPNEMLYLKHMRELKYLQKRIFKQALATS